MGYYQFWMLNEADERTQGLGLPCEAEPEAWLIADRLLAECRAVEIWNEHELVGKVGTAPPAVMETAGFVWPAPRRSRSRPAAKAARKPGVRTRRKSA